MWEEGERGCGLSCVSGQQGKGRRLGAVRISAPFPPPSRASLYQAIRKRDSSDPRSAKTRWASFPCLQLTAGSLLVKIHYVSLSKQSTVKFASGVTGLMLSHGRPWLRPSLPTPPRPDQRLPAAGSPSSQSISCFYSK